MRIKLRGQRRDDTLEVVKLGDTLSINGESFDFSRMVAGDTLPCSAISSEWFDGDVERIGGELVVTLILPNPWNYSPEQAFPVDLVDVPDGVVVFPGPLPEPLPPAGDPELEATDGLIATNNETGESFFIPATRVDGGLEA